MFTGWKGRKPGAQEPSYPIVGPTVVGPSSGSLGPASGNAYKDSLPSSSNYAVFGAPINPTSEGPPLLGKFVRFLQTKAVNTENLFLPSPDLESEVQVVKKNILRDMASYSTVNDDALQLSSYTKSPQVVAELLRLFLAALPEPLLTFQLYDSFLLTQTVQSPADRVWAYRFLLAYLPPGFRASVKQILTLLYNLSRNSDVNGMDAHALASIFGPYFLRAEEDYYYMRDDPPLVVQIVALLIQEYESVLRAAPAAPPARALNPALPQATSFPSSPMVSPRVPAKPVQIPHPLDSAAQHPASLYTQPPVPFVKRALYQISSSSFISSPSLPSSSSNSSIPSTSSSNSLSSSPVPSPAPSPAKPAPVTPAAATGSRPTTPTPPASHPQPVQGTPQRPSPTRTVQSPTSDTDEASVKLGKLRESVLMLLNEQVGTSIMALLNAIMAASTPGEAVEVSKGLVVVKKFFTDQLLTLKADKQAITAYLEAHPPPPFTVPPPTGNDEPQLNKIKVAAHQATEQFMELLFYLSSRMTNMTQAEDLPEAISLAMVAKALKTSTAEQLHRLQFPPLSATPVSTPVSTPISTPFTTPLGTPVATPTPVSTPYSTPVHTPQATPTASYSFVPTSPPPSPLPTSAPPPTTNLRATLNQRTSLSNSASSLPTPTLSSSPYHSPSGSFLSTSPAGPPPPPSRDSYVQTIDKELAATKLNLERMSAALPKCAQTELVEYAKGIRFAKQMINERISELSLGVDPDARVEAVDGEDSLSALRRALGFTITKLIEQLDAISAHAHSAGGQQMDPRPLAESLSVVSRAIANTYNQPS